MCADVGKRQLMILIPTITVIVRFQSVTAIFLIVSWALPLSSVMVEDPASVLIIMTQ